MKVLHAPVNVGNQPWSLSRAERELGVESDLVVNYGTWLGYPADRVLGTAGSRRPRDLARRLAAGLAAPFRYDVLHYYFARSILSFDDAATAGALDFLDLRLARRLGKKVFLTLQGCDVRLASVSNRRNPVTMCKPDGCALFARCIASIDARRQRFLERVLPLADRAFFLNPELGHYVPGATFLPYANVAVSAVTPRPVSSRARPLVLHAPSDPSIKGTALIEAALALLRRDHAFDYLTVQGKSHAEAMQLYADADLVIDQVLAGWYGGFAVELMSMAKPVVCYLRDEDLGFLPPRMRAELPLLRVDPRRLAADLGAIFERRAQWRDLGLAGREFVLRWHDPRRIAKAMVDAYRDPASRFDLAGAL